MTQGKTLRTSFAPKELLTIHVRKAEECTSNQGEIEKYFLDTEGRIRKAKEQLELKLLKDIKGNKKGFHGHRNNKRKTEENVDLMPNAICDQVMESMEKDKLVKDSMFLLPQPILAKSAVHSQAIQVLVAKTGRDTYYLWYRRIK